MNKLVRMNQPELVPPPGTRAGGWVWTGSTWTCDPCNDQGPPGPPCPPPGWPPPGCPPWWSGANSPPWYPGANAGVSFGTNPPQNPVRGHFWYDGVTLWIFDGAAWDSVSGPTTSTTPPSTTAPSNPQPGQQWFNGTMLYVWDGNAWVPVSATKTYIQATAPPSPNPGDLWYNGAQLYIWSGTAWAVVGPGATVGPTPTTTQVFAISQGAVSGLAAFPNWTLYPWTASPTINTGGSAAWDAIQHKFTPQVAGYYFGMIFANYNDPGPLWSGAALVKNDTGTFGGVMIAGADTYSSVAGAGWLTGSGMLYMNGTTDYLRYWRSSYSGNSEGDGFNVFLLP
jgi:hypothetical protein